MNTSKTVKITFSLLLFLVCSSFTKSGMQCCVGRYSGSDIPTLQLDFYISNFGTRDFIWKHYLYLVKDRDYTMTITAMNPAIKDKKSMITLEFTDGTKYFAMSTPRHSKYGKSLHFDFSLNRASKSGKGGGQGPKFGINTSGRGTEIAYMLCTVPLKAIKIDEVSLPMIETPAPYDYTRLYQKGLNEYRDSRYFDLLRQCLQYGWPAV